MSTKYANIQSTKGAFTTLAGTNLASGDILVISGAGNVNHAVIIARVDTTTDLSGRYTINAGDYDNSLLYQSSVASGVQFKYITGLDGSRIEQNDGTIEVLAGTSGTFYAVYTG